jgi:acetate kinase
VGRQLASLSAALQGLDAIVFTAGIGENSPMMRKRICTQAAWLGLRLDEAANMAGQFRISTEGSAVAALVIPTDEELVIAKHTIELTKTHLEAASQ